MAIAATFFKNSKVHNSTAIPPTVPEMRKDYAIELKSPTNILSPIISIKPDSMQDAPFDFNYCYIAAFHRFYWVSGWSWSNGLWTAALAVDVLTSYRDEIGSSTQYIARSSAARNGAVIDSMYPVLSTNTIDYMDIPWGWEKPTSTGGFYIVGIINGEQNNIGTMSYYAFTQAALYAFTSFLINDFSQWINIPVEEISENLQKALVNPTDYISTIKWVPLKLSDLISEGLVSAQSTLQFGYWTMPRQVTGVYHFNTLTIEKNVPGVSIKQHPLAATRGVYLNQQPYSSYVLHFPPFGEFPLDTSMMVGATSLTFRVDMDISTTSAVLTVFSNRGRVETSEIFKARTVIGVDIRLDKLGYDVSNQNFGFYALANVALNLAQPAKGETMLQQFAKTNVGQYVKDQYQTNPVGTVAGAAGLSVAALALTGGTALLPAAGAAIVGYADVENFSQTPDYKNALGQAENIVSAFGTSLITTHTAGAIGSFAEYIRQSVYVQCVFANIAPDSNARLGSPLCEIRQVSTLGGYMQISNPHMSALGSAFPDEVNAIKAHMSAGFYYE